MMRLESRSGQSGKHGQRARNRGYLYGKPEGERRKGTLEGQNQRAGQEGRLNEKQV